MLSHPFTARHFVCTAAPAAACPHLHESMQSNRTINGNLAGRTVPARRALGRPRHQLLGVLRGRDQGRAVSVRRRRARTARRTCRRGRRSAGTATCPASARANATGSASTARGRRRTGIAATRPSCCSIPYARAIAGDGRVGPGGAALRRRGSEAMRSSTDDSAPYVPRSVVDRSAFDWGDDRPLRAPLHETVIYELHVKGFTARMPDVPGASRGTYAGLAHPRRHRLPEQPRHHRGRTAADPSVRARRPPRRARAAQLLGLQLDRVLRPARRLLQRRRRGEQVHEFKQMVKALHAAGIEVILDVVYNHTAEGNHLGPMLSLQGLRQRRLLPHDGGRPPLLHGLHRHRQQPATCAIRTRCSW